MFGIIRKPSNSKRKILILKAGTMIFDILLEKRFRTVNSILKKMHSGQFHGMSGAQPIENTNIYNIKSYVYALVMTNYD